MLLACLVKFQRHIVPRSQVKRRRAAVRAFLQNDALHALPSVFRRLRRLFFVFLFQGNRLILAVGQFELGVEFVENVRLAHVDLNRHVLVSITVAARLSLSLSDTGRLSVMLLPTKQRCRQLVATLRVMGRVRVAFHDAIIGRVLVVIGDHVAVMDEI